MPIYSFCRSNQIKKWYKNNVHVITWDNFDECWFKNGIRQYPYKKIIIKMYISSENGKWWYKCIENKF